MKLLFITVTLSVVYQMRLRPVVKDTYDKEKDTFPYQILVVAAILLGCLPNEVYFVRNSIVQVSCQHASDKVSMMRVPYWLYMFALCP